MIQDYSNQENWDDINEKQITMDTVDSFLQEMEALLDRLADYANQLGHKADNMKSVENIDDGQMNEMEELISEVEESLAELIHFIEPVKMEIARCANNLEIIADDKQKIRTEPAIKNYDNAENLQEMEYNFAVDRRIMMFEIIIKVCLHLEKITDATRKLGIMPANNFHEDGKETKRYSPNDQELQNLLSLDV